MARAPRFSKEEIAKIEEVVRAQWDSLGAEYSDDRVVAVLYKDHAIDVPVYMIGSVRRAIGFHQRAAGKASPKSDRSKDVDAVASNVRKKIEDGDIILDDIEGRVNHIALELEAIGPKLTAIHDLLQEYRKRLEERRKILIQAI